VLAILRQQLAEVLRALAPLVGIACLLQVTLVHAPAQLFVQFLVGSVLAGIGMLLLFAGVEMGILPMGRFIGAEMPRKRSLKLIMAVGFTMGLATTLAEPDVLVLANEVEEVSGGALQAHPLALVIAAGVGAFGALALMRVVFGFSLRLLLAITYAVLLVLTFFAPSEFIALAYDAGSVTTGVLTTPVLLAITLGLSSVLAGRSAISDGFGLLGLGSAGAMVAVLLVGALR
jgi:hypothetical protein